MGALVKESDFQEFVDGIAASCISALGAGITGVRLLVVPVHPEAGIFIAAGLSSETRVRELAAAWVARHGNGFLSYSNIKRMLGNIPMTEQVEARFWKAMRSAVDASSDLQWKIDAEAYSWDLDGRIAKGLVDGNFTSDGGLVVKNRGLLGPTARADIATVLAVTPRALSAPEVSELLMIPVRQVRSVLETLSHAEWVLTVSTGRNKSFQAKQILRDNLSGKYKAQGWFPWHSLVWMLSVVTQVEAQQDNSLALITLWDEMLANQEHLSNLGLELPESVSEQNNASELVNRWLSDAFHVIAQALWE